MRYHNGLHHLVAPRRVQRLRNGFTVEPGVGTKTGTVACKPLHLPLGWDS